MRLKGLDWIDWGVESQGGHDGVKLEFDDSLRERYRLPTLLQE